MAGLKQCVSIVGGKDIFRSGTPPITLAVFYTQQSSTGPTDCKHWPLGRVEEVPTGSESFKIYLNKLNLLHLAGVKIIISPALRTLFVNKKLNTEVHSIIKKINRVISNPQTLQILTEAAVLDYSCETDILPHTVRGQLRQIRRVRKYTIPRCYVCSTLEQLIVKPQGPTD